LYAFESVPGTGMYTLSGQLPLLSLQVADVADQENALIIQSSGKSFYVYAEKEEKTKWLKLLTKAIQEYKSRQKTLKREKIDFEEETAPVWVPDANSTQCDLCKIAFSLIKRKHHCRSCGHVVCGPCSRNMMVVAGVSSNPERVCNKCYGNKRVTRSNTINKLQ